MKVRSRRWRRQRLLASSEKGIAGVVLLMVLVVVVCGIARTVGRLGNSNETSATTKHVDVKQTEISGTGTNTPPNRASKVKLYSRGRKDRSGAAILDMLLCHAFAFQENAIYGGVCIDNEEDKLLLPHLEDQQNLIHALGLQEELPYACPTDRSGILLRHENYFSQDTAVFTSAWLSYIRSKRRRKPFVVQPSPEIIQVAIHVRRGDVTPCREPERYLPNSYYISVVDQYITPLSFGRPINVTIYSESTSFEGWDLFQKRGYNLMLGSNVARVWEAWMAADMLVMSRSSFSLVPALFNENVVLYTPFWHKPLGNWTIVPKNGADDETKRLQEGCS
uniref:Uncharacterized protein n=1 Tax=Amphora coffeiformis TaxID=265554 RepID=A0A6S8I8Y2_9STRA|mmetsp:Transcript_12808/g.24624  ORF Transcript_12808/g.24624 Transcript_12808/m.24624 type:complete len:335 (-) Transcript_12808:59-1063(-)